MQAVLQGISQSPTTTATSYNFISANLNAGAWATSAYAGSSGNVLCPVSDTITITSFTVNVTNAPGMLSSWSFYICTGSFSSPETYVELGPFGPATIAAFATSATWTGSITIPSGSVFCISAVPSGMAPASAGVTSWAVTYVTPGNYYIMPQGSNNPATAVGTEYMPPMGGENSVPATTAANVEGVVPSAITVTRIAILTSPNPGTGTYTATCFKVNTFAASTFSAAATTTNVAVSAVGSQAFAVGDTMCIRYVSSGSTLSRVATCVTITPGTVGEQIVMFGNIQALSTTAVGYEELWGVGLNTAWSATEAAVQSITPTCTYSKLYVLLATAPGTSKTRTFVLRLAGASTALTVAITGPSTTSGSDTTHTVSAVAPALVDMMHTPASTPAASTGARFGLVQVIPQPVTPATQFLSMF